MLGLVTVWRATVLVGYNVTSKIFELTRMVGMGLGRESLTLVGQNLGARTLNRGGRSPWIAAGIPRRWLWWR